MVAIRRLAKQSLSLLICFGAVGGTAFSYNISQERALRDLAFALAIEARLVSTVC